MKRAFIVTGVLAAAVIALCVGVDAVLASPGALPAVSQDASVNAILGRSCQDCHSDQTVWPWYTIIPPVGKAIRGDVNAGKAQLNLSHWQHYNSTRKDEALAEMAALVRNKLMPPARYTLLHPRAHLSAADIAHLVQWTSAERHRLRTAASQSGEKESE
jgi:hypothetical protein